MNRVPTRETTLVTTWNPLEASGIIIKQRVLRTNLTNSTALVNCDFLGTYQNMLERVEAKEPNQIKLDLRKSHERIF